MVTFHCLFNNSLIIKSYSKFVGRAAVLVHKAGLKCTTGQVSQSHVKVYLTVLMTSLYICNNYEISRFHLTHKVFLKSLI